MSSEHRYGSRDDQLLTLVVPEHPAGADVLVVAVHGGAWYTGDRSLMETTARGLADRGLAVASIAYRQRATDPVADMLADVADAMRWAAGRHPASLVLLGDSAGAHAAWLYALRATDDPGLPQPDAVVALCGALSLDALRHPETDEQRTRFPGYVATITTDGTAPERMRDHDPLRVRAALVGSPPPLYAATSAYDFFRSATLDYLVSAVDRGDDVTLDHRGDAHPECTHSWQLRAELAETTRLFDRIAAWLGTGAAGK